MAALRVPRTFEKLNDDLRAQGGVSGEDQVRESSQTEVPPPIERDTEELVTKRGRESVDWNFFGFKKQPTLIKQQFSECFGGNFANFVAAGDNTSHLPTQTQPQTCLERQD